MSLSYRLRIKLPSGRQKSITLKKKHVTIGRDSSCDVKINDPEISRNHACLKIHPNEEVSITDLGSSNGTYLRNSPITQETVVSPGTIVRMGNTYLSVEVRGGITVDAINLPVSDNEYLNVTSLKKISHQSEAISGKHYWELCADLVQNNAGLKNLQLLLTRIAEIMDGENGTIIMNSVNANGEKASRVIRGDRLVLPLNILDEIQKSGKSFIFPSYAMNDKTNELMSQGTGSAICCPIVNDNNNFGVVYLDRSPQKQAFETADLKTLWKIAQVCGLAIQKELDNQNLNRKIEGLESERKRWFNALETKGEPPTPTQNRRFQQLLFIAMRMGRTDQHVLLKGGQGAGRTLIAQRIHAYSDRKNAPFVTLDCLDPPREILPEILFGSDVEEKISSGLLAQAHSGSLFIRELTALPFELQERLAEALSSGLFVPEGSSQKTATSVRLIASTDVDPERTHASHAFHPDLMDILKIATLEIPSLSLRPEDILPLAKHFLRVYLPSNRTVMDFSPETAELMIRYSWPGNISEMKDCMRYVASVCVEQEVHIGDLPKRLREQPAPAVPDNLNLREQMDQLEVNLIRIALDRNKQVVTRAASALGLSESTLRYRMQRLKIRE